MTARTLTTNDQPRTPTRHGGRRPGAGAPRGNTNHLITGEHSQAARYVLAALDVHPNVRELFRLLCLHGFYPVPKAHPNSRVRRQWVRDVVRFIYPILVDCSHPHFNQVNQVPESTLAHPWPGPSFTKDEIAEIKLQSSRRRARRSLPRPLAGDGSSLQRPASRFAPNAPALAPPTSNL